MNIVIQCAGSKHGNFLKSKHGREVFFVAVPTLAPKDDGYVYAHPDDFAEDGLTWRDALLRYNAARGNPVKLAHAFELYDHPVYKRLVTRFGMEKVFILSAGWGLINAAFLTPCYDITFSRSVKQKGEPWKLRPRGSIWRDLRQLPAEIDEPIVLFAGHDYVPLFCALTRSHRGHRIILYNSEIPPSAPGCILQRFHTNTKTNWHYECAGALLDGDRGRRFVKASPLRPDQRTNKREGSNSTGSLAIGKHTTEG